MPPSFETLIQKSIFVPQTIHINEKTAPYFYNTKRQLFYMSGDHCISTQWQAFFVIDFSLLAVSDLPYNLAIT